MICQFQKVHDVPPKVIDGGIELFSWICPACGTVIKSSHAPENRNCVTLESKPVLPPPPAPQKKAYTQRTTEEEYLAKLPVCKYRGEVIEQDVTCKLCGRMDQLYDIYACQVHGRCSLGVRRTAGMNLKACISCQDFKPEKIRVALMVEALQPVGGIERWCVAMARSLPLVSNNTIEISSVIIKQKAHAAPAILKELQQFTKIVFWDPANPSILANELLTTDIVITSGMGDVSELLGKYAGKVIWLCHSCCNYSKKFSTDALLAGYVTHWTSVGHLAVEAMPEKIRDQVEVIENGVEVDRCLPVYGRQWQREQWGLEEDQIAIGYVGRLSNEKRPLALAEAIKELPSQYVGIYVGSGQHEAELRQQAYELVRDRVKFVGPVNMLGDVFAALDVGLLVSPAEGFCLSRAEMMMAGLRLVTTPTGEIPRLTEIHGDLCEIVPIGATGKHIAKAIQTSLTVCDYVDKAKWVTWERYTAIAMAGRWARYLEKIFGENNK